MKTILLVVGWLIAVILLVTYRDELAIHLSNWLGLTFLILNTELPITGRQLGIILSIAFSLPLPIFWVASKIYEDS